MYTIAHIENDYTEKFGVPRQSGLVNEVSSRIVFEQEFRNPEALRGLEGFTHIWLIWEFSEAKRRGEKEKTVAGESAAACGVAGDASSEQKCEWRPTVRPPRLGGNVRMGVFATRSPFRPNPIGLSCVELEAVEYNTADGPVIRVKGADLMNGTPILDIKPYIPYADCKTDAKGGFTDENEFEKMEVVIPEEIGEKLEEKETAELIGVLAQDPRPAYQRGQKREYSFAFSHYDITFLAREKEIIVTGIRRSDGN